MTTATAERRRALFADGQEPLFGGEALAPDRPAAPWERREAPEREARREASGPEARSEAPAHETRSQARMPEAHPEARVHDQQPAARVHDGNPGVRVRTEPPAAPAPETIVGDDLRAPRTVGAPLTGPTLDDVMSRVWEGLVTGLPAACPVCRGEVVPALGGPLSGRCSSCGTTID